MNENAEFLGKVGDPGAAALPVLFPTGRAPIADDFRRAQGTVVDPHLPNLPVDLWSDGQLFVGIYRPQFAGKARPTELTAITPVVQLSVHDKGNGLGASVHDDANMVPLA